MCLLIRMARNNVVISSIISLYEIPYLIINHSCTRTFPWFCWLPCKSAENGVIVLENVKNRDGRSFNMFDKRKPLPLDHITLVFKELAHFHGKWLVWISKAKVCCYLGFYNTWFVSKMCRFFDDMLCITSYTNPMRR